MDLSRVIYLGEEGVITTTLSSFSKSQRSRMETIYNPKVQRKNKYGDN